MILCVFMQNILKELINLKQNKMEITTEEMEEWIILNEYNNYREKEYAPMSLEKFLIKKLIEVRKELSTFKSE